MVEAPKLGFYSSLGEGCSSWAFTPCRLLPSLLGGMRCTYTPDIRFSDLTTSPQTCAPRSLRGRSKEVLDLLSAVMGAVSLTAYRTYSGNVERGLYRDTGSSLQMTVRGAYNL